MPRSEGSFPPYSSQVRENEEDPGYNVRKGAAASSLMMIIIHSHFSLHAKSFDMSSGYMIGIPACSTGSNMKEKDSTFMKLALEKARIAFDMGEVPVGAAAVMDGRVIESAYNLVEECQDPTAHAELLVLRSCFEKLGTRRLHGVTIYSTLEPCPMCAGALILARVDRLVFGAFDPKAGACGTLMNLVRDNRFNHLVEVTAPVLEDECSAILSEFFLKLRKNKS